MFLFFVSAAANVCFPEGKSIQVSFATDCSYSEMYNNDGPTILKSIHKMFNTTKKVYLDTFNVSLFLDEVVIKTSCSDSWNAKCTPQYNMSIQLTNFTTWASKKKSNTIWQLLTKCKTSKVQGLAVPFLLNNAGFSVISTDGDGTTTMMHEIAHNFGALHDSQFGKCACTESSCESGYIMSRIDRYGLTEFSACSKSQICNGLKNAPTSIKKDIKTCGNGVVDKGEECDGGEFCSMECKLLPGMECSDYNFPGCCENGKFKPRGSVCRDPLSSCESVSYCDGQSSQCPLPNIKVDGTACEHGKCASGLCTSRNHYALNVTKKVPCDWGLSCSVSVLENNKCIDTNLIYWDGIDCSWSLGKCSRGNCNPKILFYLFAAILFLFMFYLMFFMEKRRRIVFPPRQSSLNKS